MRWSVVPTAVLYFAIGCMQTYNRTADDVVDAAIGQIFFFWIGSGLLFSDCYNVLILTV